MAVPMTASPSTGIESRLTMEGVTVNSVNNTSGGAILQFNGSPRPVDYEHISRILSACSNGPTSSQASARPPPTEQSSAMFLAQLVAGIGSVTIRNSTVNGINNTSGGLIFTINNTSQSSNVAGTPEYERTSNLYGRTDEPKMNRSNPTAPHAGQAPPGYEPSWNKRSERGV